MQASEVQVGDMEQSLHHLNLKNVLVFVNVKARRGRDAEQLIVKWLESHGITILNPAFDCVRDDISAAIRAHQAQADAVVIGGGDGSINHGLAALLETRLPFLVVPLGTANNFARTLNLPTAIEETLGLLKNGRIVDIDVGLANGIPFLNVVGLGLSTQVNRLVRSRMKRLFGAIAFVWTALKVARRMSPFRVWIECEGWVHRSHTWQITVCNGRNYGAGLTIDERASFTDQILHGLSTEIDAWWKSFGLVFALMSGRFKPEHSVTRFSGSKVLIRTRVPMRVDLDGDIKASTPLEVMVRPKAVRAIVPT